MTELSAQRTKHELAEFLRQQRNRLTPADVGLPSHGTRRTPGLRREEVAALAGVGLTWYTWFEQGRDIQVSEKVLLGIAKALKLDDAQCSYLFMLAHKRPPPPEAHQLLTVSPLTQKLMDELARPAYVINLGWDVIAWNAGADKLFTFSERSHQERNLLRMVFSAPDFRNRIVNWQDDAPKLLAQFKYDRAIAVEDNQMQSLVSELTLLSADFKRWYNSPDNQPPRRGLMTLITNKTKQTTYQHETLLVDEHRHLRMVVYFAED